MLLTVARCPSVKDDLQVNDWKDSIQDVQQMMESMMVVCSAGMETEASLAVNYCCFLVSLDLA